MSNLTWYDAKFDVLDAKLGVFASQQGKMPLKRHLKKAGYTKTVSIFRVYIKCCPVALYPFYLFKIKYSLLNKTPLIDKYLPLIPLNILVALFLVYS